MLRCWIVIVYYCHCMIYFLDDEFWVQQRTRMSVVPTGFSYDTLNSALRVFSQNLTTLDISACLDTSIFWPGHHEINAETPHWPFLRILKVTLRVVLPFGYWYFEGTNRVTPSSTTVTPLLAALAKAVKQMSVLEHFAIIVGHG